jgi:hypothetical protein
VSLCKACGGEFRKGKLAFIVGGNDKKLFGAIVCPSCAKGGLLLVAPKLGPVVKKVERRTDEVERALRQLTMLAAAARASARNIVSNQAMADEFSAKAEGIESAITVLKDIGRIAS